MVLAQMTDPVIALFVVIALSLIVGQAIIIQFLMDRRDLRPYLEPPLRERGATFLSASTPAWFCRGPFPRVELRIGPASRVGTAGHLFYTRIVRVRDRDGAERELWARVDLALWRIARVRWRAVDRANLSPEIQAILEH